MKIGSIVELTTNHYSLENLKRCGQITPFVKIPYIVRELDLDVVANKEIIRLEEIINPIRIWRDGQVMECGFVKELFRELLAPEEQINVQELVNSLQLEEV